MLPDRVGGAARVLVPGVGVEREPVEVGVQRGQLRRRRALDLDHVEGAAR